jgi:ABC-type dipeptide/oligopeptide/nickel transport system permease component
MGRLVVQAVWDNDFPVLLPAVLLFTVVFVVMNLLADLAYAYVDPRIRYS